MYCAKIDKFYVSPNGIFYHINDKVNALDILKHKLNNDETMELVVERWDKEQHWLVDWNKDNLVEGFYPNCTVSFDISSSRFYRTMNHVDEKLENVRNINVKRMKVIEE